MLFVSIIKAQVGQHLEAIKLFKRPKIPEGVEIKHFVGIFGDMDAILIFSSPV